jgi:hypothetical protein
MHLAVLSNDWVELAGKLIVLITVIIGAWEARRAHRRGIINTAKIEHIEKGVNGGDVLPESEVNLPK